MQQRYPYANASGHLPEDSMESYKIRKPSNNSSGKAFREMTSQQSRPAADREEILPKTCPGRFAVNGASYRGRSGKTLP